MKLESLESRALTGALGGVAATRLALAAFGFAEVATPTVATEVRPTSDLLAKGEPMSRASPKGVHQKVVVYRSARLWRADRYRFASLL